MKPALEIPDPLFNRANARAMSDGLKLEDVVTSTLIAYLAKPKSSAKQAIKPCPFPLVRGKGGPLLKRMKTGRFL